MKIAIVGCGAVGSFYGAKLAHAGHEVHFLLRSDFEVVQRQGVMIKSPGGDFSVHPHCAQRPDEIGPSDLVIVALKTTANDQFPRLLPPLVGPRTAILTLQNGLGNEAKLSGLFPSEQILGGLCFVCLNRTAPGQIQHLGHGDITIGEYLRPSRERTRSLGKVFQDAGVACVIKENLEQAHWEKLVWNVPFNGLGVAGSLGFEAVETGRLLTGQEHGIPLAIRVARTLSTAELLGDPRWQRLVRALMQEVIEAARALGFAVAENLAEELIARTRTMGAYKASTVLDFEKGLPIELESVFLEPLRQARSAGCGSVYLGNLCAMLAGITDAAPEAIGT